MEPIAVAFSLASSGGEGSRERRPFLSADPWNGILPSPLLYFTLGEGSIYPSLDGNTPHTEHRSVWTFSPGCPGNSTRARRTPAPFSPSGPLSPSPRKFYFDGGQVEIAAELVHELDADGKQLRVVKRTDYTAEKVRTLCTGLEDLRARWADSTERAASMDQLADRGIDFNTITTQAGKPPEAREIPNDLLEKYAIDGEIQFTLPDVLKVAPIWRHGNVAEICRKREAQTNSVPSSANSNRC